MAVHTAFGFLLASLAISLMIPKNGIMNFFVGRRIGNHIVRRLFLQMSIVSLILSYIVFQIFKSGYFGTGFSLAILSAAYIMAILFILMIAVPSINILEQDRRIAEQELNATSTYLNATPDPIVIVDDSGKIFLSNALMNKVFGYRSSDLIGNNISSLVSTELGHLYKKHIKDFKETNGQSGGLGPVLANKNITSFIETDFLDKKGNKIPVELALNSIISPKGNKTIVAFRDISRRVEAERKYRLANDKVLAALDASIIGIWDYDIKDGSIEWDDTMYSIYGLDKERVNIKFSIWMNHVHKDDFDRVLKILENSISQKTPYDDDFRIVWPDGSIRYIRGKGSVYLDKDGEVIRMLGTNWDITEQKRMSWPWRQVQNRIGCSSMRHPLPLQCSTPIWSIWPHPKNGWKTTT